jgi:hypothetical protein
VSSLPARAFATGCLAFVVCGCSATPTEVRGTFVGPRRVDVTIAVPPGHDSEGERYAYAALTTLKILDAWLPPFGDSTLAVTADATRWWSAPAAMTPEYAVARAVSRRYWERAIDARDLPPWFVGALAEYCARRAVSKIVDERYLAVYRSRVEERYFGGFVPRELRVPLRVEDQGDPVDEYRARPRGTDAGALEAKGLLALGTLERWVGSPTFDEIVAAFVREGGQPSLQSFAAVARRVSGQDLTWFFAQTLESQSVIDYGVIALSSEEQPDGWYTTSVAVQRFGDGVFPGARGRRGVVVETTFADAETIRDAWDGRGSTATFQYRSRSRAVSTEVDPDRVVLLDVNRGNNGATLDSGPARTAASRWAARWMIWLEDALLTCVAFT